MDEMMPAETPLAFGLHPNAEIGFKLREGVRFCGDVLALQPREAESQGGLSVEEKVDTSVLNVCALYSSVKFKSKHRYCYWRELWVPLLLSTNKPFTAGKIGP